MEANIVPSTGAIPKLAFIGWLAIQNRLLMKEGLLKWGICVDASYAETELRLHWNIQRVSSVIG